MGPSVSRATCNVSLDFFQSVQHLPLPNPASYPFLTSTSHAKFYLNTCFHSTQCAATLTFNLNPGKGILSPLEKVEWSNLNTNPASFTTYWCLAAPETNIEAGKTQKKDFKTKIADFIIRFYAFHITVNVYSHAHMHTHIHLS